MTTLYSIQLYCSYIRLQSESITYLTDLVYDSQRVPRDIQHRPLVFTFTLLQIKKKKLFSSRSSLFKTFSSVYNLILFLKSNKRGLTFVLIIHTRRVSNNMATSPIKCVIIIKMGINFKKRI